MSDRPDVLEKRAILGVLALASLLACAALSPALTAGAGYTWDDVSLVAQNPLWHASDALQRIFSGALFQTTADFDNDYYRPIVALSYWIETRIFGGWALGHHGVNVLVHLACLGLSARFLLRRVDLRGIRPSVATGWLAVALVMLAIHPSRPESVAWISGRTDPLSLLFALLAMEAFRAGGRLRVPLSTALFVLALLCKETALMLAFAFALDAWLMPEPATTETRRARARVAGLTALAFALRLWLLPTEGRTLGNARGVLTAIGLYAKNLFVPFPPSLVTGVFPVDAAGEPQYPVLWLALGAAVALLFLALTLCGLRQPKLRPYVADAMWLLLPLAPASQLVQLPLVGHVSLRFLYIPLLGASALMLRTGLAWSRKRALSPRVGFALAAALTLLYAPFTYAYAGAFRSDRALWGYELALDPDRSPVLEYALRHVPVADLATQYALSERAVQVASRNGHQQVAARVAVHWAGVYFRALPPDACPDDLVRALDHLALGKPAHLGGEHAIDVQLGPRDAAQLRAENGDFWTLRADALLRCGALAQALDSLSSAPRTLATATARARLLALAGQWRNAEIELANARDDYPFAPSVSRTAAAVERARELAASGNATPIARLVVTTQVHMGLGDLAGARRVLEAAPDAAREEPSFHQAFIELELAAGRRDSAAERLLEARAVLPSAAALWEALQSRIEASGQR